MNREKALTDWHYKAIDADAIGELSAVPCIKLSVFVFF